jgi:hypothetical protein
VGALTVARRSSNAVFAIIFPDGGEKYWSERLWDEPSSLVPSADGPGTGEEQG